MSLMLVNGFTIFSLRVLLVLVICKWAFGERMNICNFLYMVNFSITYILFCSSLALFGWAIDEMEFILAIVKQKKEVNHKYKHPEVGLSFIPVVHLLAMDDEEDAELKMKFL